MSEKDSMIVQNLLFIISMMMSVGAFLYSYFNNSKKYELSNDYRREILNWFGKTLIIMKEAESLDQESIEKKNQLLVKLSTQIDIGRFYFPNIDKGDGKGQNEPAAYKGYRNVVIDTLVFYYSLLNRPDSSEQIERLISLQRIYTSYVFEQLNPKDYLKQIKKHTEQNVFISKGFEDSGEKSLIDIDNYINKKELQ